MFPTNTDIQYTFLYIYVIAQRNGFLSFSDLTSDGYLCADGQPPGSRDYEEHQYVNTQSLENLDSLAQGPNRQRGARAPDSPKKDLFDMSKSRDFV